MAVVAIILNEVTNELKKKMLLAHKIELRPTAEQAIYLEKACGSKRHCFNQLLAHFSKPDKPDSKWSKNEAY